MEQEGAQADTGTSQSEIRRCAVMARQRRIGGDAHRSAAAADTFKGDVRIYSLHQPNNNKY